MPRALAERERASERERESGGEFGRLRENLQGVRVEERKSKGGRAFLLAPAFIIYLIF